jgi:hypothetical protein
MDKIKLLTISVITLLLLNVATLFFLISSVGGRPERGMNHPRPDKIIIEKLHFDEKQQKEYRELIHWHRTRINDFDSQIHKIKQELYLQLLKSKVDDKVEDSLINKLSLLQKQIEATHFKHFQDIKKLCKKDQIQDFNELTEELTHIFSPPPPKPND